MSTGNILLIIAIISLTILVILITRFWPIKYNDDFVEKMTSYCAEEYVLDKYNDEQLYTKQGELRQKAITAIEEKKSEYDYFYKAPYTRNKFIEYLQNNNLLSDKYTLHSKDRHSVYYSFVAFYENYKKNLQKNKSGFISLESFNIMKNSAKADYVGVYIIYNKTRNKYYVGQAKRMFYRVAQHFGSHGNGDIYADYKYGDDFYVRLIKLSDSGFDNIDQLEKHYIDLYAAEETGYNKTKGNDI